MNKLIKNVFKFKQGCEQHILVFICFDYITSLTNQEAFA